MPLFAPGSTPAGADGQFQYGSGGAFAAANFYREDANTIAQRNGTTAQILYVYNNYTSPTVLETGQFKWSFNILDIGSIPGSGGGSIREVRLGQFNSDNTLRNGWDINPGSDWSYFVANGGKRIKVASGVGVDLSVAWRLAWSDSTAVELGTADTGLSRNAAGVVEVNNGTAGTYRDMKLRSEILTGVFATSANAPTISSSGTIAPTTSIAFVSGTSTISTITAPSPISSGGGQITLIPTGAWATNTAGNIALATTAVVNKALTMTYDATTTKWYPSY